jgi:uncharacterized phage-like protein YoqJ
MSAIWGFTGHRPPGLVNDPDVWIDYHKKILPRLVDLGKGIIEKEQIEYAVIGMAQGFDTGMAIACVQLGIPYLAAVPGSWFSNRMYPKDRKIYSELLDHADKVVFVDQVETYQLVGGNIVHKLHRRNEFIVDECDVLGVLWNGNPSGTSNCINYARRQGKPYHNFWNSWVNGRDKKATSTIEIRRI